MYQMQMPQQLSAAALNNTAGWVPFQPFNPMLGNLPPGLTQALQLPQPEGLEAALQARQAAMGKLLQSVGNLLGALGPLLAQLGGFGLPQMRGPGMGLPGAMGGAAQDGTQGAGMSAPASTLNQGFPPMLTGSPLGMPPMQTAVPPQFMQGPAAPNGGVGTGAAYGTDPATIPMDGDRATRELARNFDQIKPDGGFITRQDLQTIANGGSPGDMKGGPTPELQAAAKYLLDNPAAFDKLETADSNAQGKVGHKDGRIGKGDVNAALQRTGFAAGEKETTQTLVRHFDELKTKDNCIDVNLLKQIAATGVMPNGQPAPPDVLKAAQDVANRPELANKLDNAARIRNGDGDQRGDGLISKEDLNESLSGAQTTVKPNLFTLFTGAPMVQGNDGKTGVSLDAVAARNDTDPLRMARPEIVG